MEYFDDATIARLLKTSLKTATYNGKVWRNQDNDGGSTEAQFVRWLSISDPEAAVVEDVQRIRNHPLVSPDVRIHGFLFDVKTGQLIEVKEASEAGQTLAVSSD